MKAAEGEGKTRRRGHTAQRDVEADAPVAGGEPLGDAPMAESEGSERRASGRAELVQRIDKALIEIEGLRREAHYHDSEIERLSEETRRMIEELQEELKAA